jgi:hypothetical protein
MKNKARLQKAINREPIDRLMTYDLLNNANLLVKYGGFDFNENYSFDELVDINVKTFKAIGVDMTRGVYDPIHHWMDGKIKNWIRFFGIDPDKWGVSQSGDTAWISKRPFSNLRELEKNMPQYPKYEEVEAWYKPFIMKMQAVFDANDMIFVGAVEGPICDAYTYTDMELFMMALYDAPELVTHLLDCMGRYSAYVARVYAENSTVPLFFMGEDTACNTGPILSPNFIRQYGIPRWRWITEPVQEKSMKFIFHTDGRYGELLNIIINELDADAINPIERNGCNDIFDIRFRYPQTLLFGNVCCAVTLPHGNVFDVEDETLELIEKLGVQGGIFIGSSSEVHDLVPVENAVAMYHNVHEYGSFPVDVKRIQQRRKAIQSELVVRKWSSLAV